MFKSFWNDELDRLKMVSIDMHALWCQFGRPRQGVINAVRLTAKLDYKRAIKQAAVDYEQDNADDLNKHFTDKDTTTFWKCWNSKYQKSLSTPVSIDGQTDPLKIANDFKDYYSNIYVNSSVNVSAVNEYNNAYSSMPVDTESCVIDIDVVDVEY